jgi:hypothetical protein
MAADARSGVECSHSPPENLMSLKRFLVFAFDPTAAAGGWRDFVADADSKEAAEAIAEKLYGRIQIVDTDYQESVAGSKVHLVYSLYREYEYAQH